MDRDLEDWQAIEAELARVRQALGVGQHDIRGQRTGVGVGLGHAAVPGAEGLGSTLLAWYERALRATRELGHADDEGTLLSNIGAVHQSRGELDKALAHFEQALAIVRAVRDRAGDAVTLLNISLVRRSRGELAAAVAALERAVDLDELVGHLDLESDRRVLE